MGRENYNQINSVGQSIIICLCVLCVSAVKLSIFLALRLYPIEIPKQPVNSALV